MDNEEIKNDLKKLLELVSKRASQDDVGSSRQEPAVNNYPNAAAVLDDKNSPSAHAILAMQEISKNIRENLDAVEKKESPLEKFTDLIMAVTAHDEYTKLDDDEQLQNFKSFHSIVPNREHAEEDEKSVKSVESSLEKFTDIIMAVTKHDVYNENDDDDFIKTAPLPREDSTTTLTAHSNENVNAEMEVLEHVHDLSSEAIVSEEKRNPEVELEVELQVKVKSDADLDAIAAALKNITFISTRVTESTPKEPVNYPTINSSINDDLMHESAVLIASESDCLECALYAFEKSEEIEEIKPAIVVENYSQEIESNEEEYFENFVGETEEMSPYESDERLSAVTTHVGVDIDEMPTLVQPFEEDPKKEIDINKSKFQVDSVADALKNVEFTPSSVTILNVFKDSNKSNENLSPENNSNTQSTLNKNAIIPSDANMFDITSSVVPENVSTISFRHEVYDSQATFSMQPEKIEMVPKGADFLFGQSKVPVEKKQRHDCNCELKTKQKQKDFEEIMKRTAEAIEKIERESQELDEITSVEDTMKNVEEKLESELKSSVKSVMSRVDLRTFSQTVVDEMKNAMSTDHHMCQCEARREKRKNELEEIYKSEERENNLKLPVTSMMKSLIFKKAPQDESREETESHDEEIGNEEIVQVEALDEDPILKRLREIIFGGASSDVEENIPEKFSKVQFKFTNPKTLNRNSQYFKSCPCLDSNEIIYRSKPESSDIKQKIQEFENLSAKSSAVSIKPIKSQASLIVMNVEVLKAPVEEELRKCVCFEAKKEPKMSLPVEDKIQKVVCCQNRKKNADEQKTPTEGEHKCCTLKKLNRNEEPKLVLNTPDIEELPLKVKLKRISKAKMATLSEEKELNTFYNRVLMMDDENTVKKNPKSRIEDKPDDDGFSSLPNVSSNNLSEVASSAWIDENISFIVNDEEERKKSNRVSLGFGYPREDQRHSHQKEEEHEKECSPSTSNESTPSKFTSRLRQCKCMMQRISKSILGKK